MESEKAQLEQDQVVKERERRVLEGRRKALEEKRKLLESQLDVNDPASHRTKETGASITVLQRELELIRIMSIQITHLFGCIFFWFTDQKNFILYRRSI